MTRHDRSRYPREEGARPLSPEDSLPTEYIEGEWRIATHDGEPWAVVTYAEEPSPETGHVGWCWWALGRMGEASSYEAAKAAAVRALEEVMP